MAAYYPAYALLVKAVEAQLVELLKMIFPGVKHVIYVLGVIKMPEGITVVETDGVKTLKLHNIPLGLLLVKKNLLF
jgi:hypothetical protein